MMSGTAALSTERLTGLIASVGSDSHFEWVVMKYPSTASSSAFGCYVQPFTLLLATNSVKPDPTQDLESLNHSSLILNHSSLNHRILNHRILNHRILNDRILNDR